METKDRNIYPKKTTTATLHGIIIDIEGFSKHHPGGDHIVAFGGTDCSGAFSSMHGLNSKTHLETLRKSPFYLGEAGTTTTTTTTTTYDSPFALDLLRSISSSLKGISPYAPWQWWV